MKATIEQRFGEVLRFAEGTFGKNKGFQARLSELTGVQVARAVEANFLQEGEQ